MGVFEGVMDGVGVVEGVTLLVGELEGVTEGVGVSLAVTDPVGVGEGVLLLHYFVVNFDVNAYRNVCDRKIKM